MKRIQEKILEPIVAITLIITLTLVEFLVVGMQIVSYAIENIETTNMENVLFSAIFVDKNGNETNFLETDMNDENSKLKIAIKVEKEGYFNGEIHIDNSNFKLKTDTKNDYINDISEYSVKLNQIIAGSEVVLELGIEAIKDDEYELNNLNKTSDISISGTYVMGKNSEKQINATRQLGLKFNPENSNEIEKSTNIITNRIYTIGEENKRIVQLEITSKLQNNIYPIKKTKIVADMLEGAEGVYVSKRGTYATNNDYRDIEVNQYDNEVEIEILNPEENGTIGWNKKGQDKIIVTYILPEDVDVTNKQISVNFEIELYDENNTIVNSETNVTINEEKDGVVSYELQGPDELYKGYLYYGEESNITAKTIIDIKAKDVVTAVKVTEGNIRYTDQNVANAKYYSTRIDKENARRILGDSGRIEIKSETGMTLGTIDREFIEQTGSDKVEIGYEGQRGIIIEAHNIENEGRLEFEHSIVIQENAEIKEELKNFNELKIDGTLTTDKNIETKQSEKVIGLKEPETFAKFTSNINTLSTLQTNENVEFNVILKTDDIKYDLYKNPIIEIQLPNEITNIDANFNGVFLDNLQVKNASIYDTANGNKAMRIELEGEQEEHSNDLSEGIIININANIDLSRLASTKDTEIKMLYTNENSGGNVFEQSVPIRIKSKEGLLVYNKVENFNDNGDVIETEDAETVTETVKKDSQGKEVNANTVLVNNYETEIKNVTIIGKNADDTTIDLNILKNINITKDSKISYSNNGEDWTDNADEIEDVKAYKIETEEVGSSETIALNYEFKIPDKLDYNQMAKLEQSVSYEYQGQELNQVFGLELQTEKMQLTESNVNNNDSNNESYENNDESSTGNNSNIIAASNSSQTSELQVNTTTKLATKELADQEAIYEGETLTNIITLTNNTGNDLSNVVVRVDQKNAVLYDIVEVEAMNVGIDGSEGATVIEHVYNELQTGAKTFRTIETLRKGQTINLQYEVVAKYSTGNKTTYGDIEVSANGIDTINKRTIENQINDAELKLRSQFTFTEEMQLYADNLAPTVANIKNTSGRELKDIEVEIKVSGLYFDEIDEEIEIYENINDEMEEIDYARLKNLKYDKNTRTITFKLDKIEANKEIEVLLKSVADKISTNAKDATAGIVFTVKTEEGNTYTSNLTLRNYAQTEKDMTIRLESDIAEGQTLKEGDNFNVRIIIKNNSDEESQYGVYDTFGDEFTIKSAKIKRGSDVEEILFTEEEQEDAIFDYKGNIRAGEEIEFEISIIVDTNDMVENEITNIAEIYFEDEQYSRIQSNELTFKIDEYDDGDNGDDEEEDGEDDGVIEFDPNNPNNIGKNKISGIAWLDSNKDGKMNSDEEKLSGIKVKIADKETGEFLNKDTQTDGNGKYTISVDNGEYIIIFLYDSQKYNVTEYKKSGVGDQENCDVISKDIIIDSEEITAGITDGIIVSDDDISNISIGLYEKEKFDLRLDKYVSKITIQAGQETYTQEYNNEKLAKLEIGEKYYEGSLAIIEYTINITNEGDIEGYANDIVDYMPTGLQFNSELNKDWYVASDGSLHTQALTTEKINTGETKQIKLILTKTLSENSAGLMANTAEIYKSSNNLNIDDQDSIAGNKATNEDDISTASAIISISTGIVKVSLAIIFIVLVIAGVVIIIIKRKEVNSSEENDK